MYEELVKRLREEAEPCEKSGCKQTANEMREAADAIEELQDALGRKEHFDSLAEQNCKQTPSVRGVIVSANHGITYVGYDEPKPTTNYDRIVSKTPEELAEFLIQDGDCPPERMYPDSCPNCDRVTPKVCYDCWLDWLKQEAKE